MATTKPGNHVLVTGAAGLLGGWIVTRLASLGYQVIATDIHDAAPNAPATATWVRGDIREPDFLDELLGSSEISGIVHCAGLLQFACELEPRLAVEVNVEGTMNLLAVAKRRGVARMVMMSTSAVYGNQTAYLDEDALIGAPHGLVGVYPATKWLAERFGLAFRKSGSGPEFVALRLGFVFGLGRPRSAGLSDVIQRIYGALLRGETFDVAEASGEECWHFVHVLDVCDSIISALVSQSDPTGIYNVAGPPAMYMSLHSFIESVSKVAGRPAKGTLTGRAASGPKLDTRRLATCIGFEPSFTIERGVYHDQSTLLSL